MPENSNHALAPMVRKLSLWCSLTAEDGTQILSLPFQHRHLDAGQYLVWDGDKPQSCCLLLSGFA